QRRSAQHAEPGARLAEPAELVGQPFGVQGPAFAVPAHEHGLGYRESLSPAIMAAPACRWWPGTPSWKTVELGPSLEPVRVAPAEPDHPGRDRIQRRPPGDVVIAKPEHLGHAI